MKKKIKIIYTGGTIGMVRDKNSSALMPFNFEALYHEVPELRMLDLDFEVESFIQPIDSTNITPTEWILLAQIIKRDYNLYDGFVILHGSDTMAFTASALSFLMQGLTKPVVLTGAQLPINILRSDARENLLTSLEIAAAYDAKGQAIVNEVCIYFEYKLYRGNRTYKHSSENFKAYQSPNYPLLAEAGTQIKYNANALMPIKTIEPTFFYKMEAEVLSISLFPGLQFEWIEKCLGDMKGIKTLILHTYGSGNAPQNASLEKIIRNLTQAHIPVVNVSQCYSGSVKQGQYEVSRWLADYEVISARDMTREAALTKAMFCLAHSNDLEEFTNLYTLNISGEIS